MFDLFGHLNIGQTSFQLRPKESLNIFSNSSERFYPAIGDEHALGGWLLSDKSKAHETDQN